MSMDYWGIIGYGVNTNNIFDYIDTEKVRMILKRKFPNAEFEENIFDDDTFCGDPYDSFAEFLCGLDHKHIMTYDSNGQGEEYFLYTPRYPWFITDRDPKNIDELTEYILSILQRVSNRPKEEISRFIDYIDETGCG